MDSVCVLFCCLYQLYIRDREYIGQQGVKRTPGAQVGHDIVSLGLWLSFWMVYSYMDIIIFTVGLEPAVQPLVARAPK